jgi:hypothetical protein
LNWLEPIWNEISRQVHVDKIYLETHRDMFGRRRGEETRMVFNAQIKPHSYRVFQCE